MAARAPFLFDDVDVAVDVAPAPAPAHLRLVPDRDRLARLVLDVRDRLRVLAKRVARDWDADVDDLHQLALETAYQRARVYDPTRSAFFTYLYKPVLKALVGQCRAERKRREDLADITESYVLEHDAWETPEDQVVEAEERERMKRRVAAALADLGEEERRMVVRHVVEGVPLTVLQAELGIVKYREVWGRYGAAVKELGKRLRGMKAAGV